MRRDIASYLALLFAIGCKQEAPTASVAAPQPPAAVPPPPRPAPIEQAYGGKYLVILSSSRARGAEPPSIAVLEAKPELGAKIARLDSSKLKNLMPCYEIVVARAFDAPAEARAWSKELAALGIDHYVKNAGKYVGRQPSIDAYCEARRSAPNDACAGARFVERWEEALFVPLGEPAAAPGNLAPFRGNRAVWRAALAEKVHGAHRAGDVMVVFDPAGGEPMRCKVTGFSVLVRGLPHFSYFESEGARAPGCGEPELFADLDCPASIISPVALAVPHDRPLPARYGFEGFERTEHPLRGAALALLEKSSAYAALLAEARDGASADGAELKKTFGFRVASNGKRELLVVRAVLYTGEGLTECGAEDVRVELQGAFELKDGVLGAIALPFRRVELRTLTGILDLERDGRLETFDVSPPTQYTVRRSDDSEACALVVPFCDCGC